MLEKVMACEGPFVWFEIICGCAHVHFAKPGVAYAFLPALQGKVCLVLQSLNINTAISPSH